MKKSQKTYTVFQLASAILMIVTLLWLTVSTPFVYASQQQQTTQDKEAKAQCPLAGNEEESAKPLGNTAEEKNSNSSSFSEEYLHDHHIDDYFFYIASQYHNCENAGAYVAYHGKVQVPPPNAA